MGGLTPGEEALPAGHQTGGGGERQDAGDSQEPEESTDRGQVPLPEGGVERDSGDFLQRQRVGEGFRRCTFTGPTRVFGKKSPSPNFQAPSARSGSGGFYPWRTGPADREQQLVSERHEGLRDQWSSCSHLSGCPLPSLHRPLHVAAPLCGRLRAGEVQPSDGLPQHPAGRRDGEGDKPSTYARLQHQDVAAERTRTCRTG